MDDIFAFLDVMQATFGRLDFLPVADGKIHRFHVPGDRHGSKNGVYQLFPEGIVSGWYGSWRDAGNWHNWSSRQPANPIEAELMRQRSEQVNHLRDADLKKKHQETAENAQRIWRDACPADPNHPYLVAKGCQPHDLRQMGPMLLVPLYHEGQLVNLQRIFPNGSKWFLEGGMVKGCYSPIGHPIPGQTLTICEGWATGATIHEETDTAVACAMNCGNLLAAGENLRRLYPEAVLIIAGDDDRLTEGNPGRTAATKAATALGCGRVLPQWSDDAPLEFSDFNDLRQYRRAQL
ncbi:topoisomerase [Pseudomonas alkylphenolica]|uniref:Topoisomerase n=1 Tax=Pseudomonas alkylphenolica TaxID=237609 RepID=A0A443ZJV2_9PSED|nr:toprim domain-containing protein [Pseudomonas alkylphenolica]RWU19219.1 topoisomerase [Pseudomonas alkylphenolica]